MELNCTTDSYETLYARWLEKPGELLDWAEYRPGEKLLDLCGGTGAVSKEALRRGASQVWLLDLNPRVDDERIMICRARAEELRGGVYNPLAADEEWEHPYARRDDRYWGPDRSGVYGTKDPWDLVVCRQALGYLDLQRTAQAVWSVLKPGGRFVFNNFVKPKWSFKPYRYQDRWFVEASGFFGRRVFHLQATDGDFDVTAFRWYTPKEIQRYFYEPYWTLLKREVTSRSVRFCFQRAT